MAHELTYVFGTEFLCGHLQPRACPRVIVLQGFKREFAHTQVFARRFAHDYHRLRG